MFRKLGRQLMLYNLLILMVVLAVISIFAFIGSSKVNTGKVTEAMWNAALSGHLPTDKYWHSPNHGQGQLIVIHTDMQGNVLSTEAQTDVSGIDISKLSSLVLECPDSSGALTYSNKAYVYLRFMKYPQQDVLIVMQESISLWRAILSYISRVLPVIIASIFLVYLASLAITARALVPIKRAWKRQVEFTGDASHELRTPIAVIQSNLEVVMDEPDQLIRNKDKWLQNIKAESDRMQKLVEDLLTLSRTDESQQVLKKTLFSLSQELSTALNPLIPYAQNKGVTLYSDVSADFLCWGDAERIKQLIVILTDNAIKHTQNGGKVCVSSEVQNRTVKISVCDTGEGMEKEQLEKIFERFYRIDKARERENGGSGLGLSIAKWIVDEHKGTITVISNPGEGSTFTVLLPLK